MGLGYYHTERFVFDETTGMNQANGTWQYKPPSALDVPIDMRVALLPNAKNPLNILGSKASGEPPLLMTASIFFAIKDAIAAARADAGVTTVFPLDAPATVDVIQANCCTETTQFTL